MVSIRLHGDEHWHYATTLDGKVVECAANGYLRSSSKPARISTEPAIKRSSVPHRRSSSTRLSIGARRFLVILVEFADVHFSTASPAESFSALLNNEGYNKGGATGSAHDYFIENSLGRFNPVFDVIGPVRVSKNRSAYGENKSKDEGGTDKDIPGLFSEACQLAASKGLVDFSSYDTDNDGYVDNVFFYYAGCNEAEGGGSDAIWPHAGTLHEANITHNGVRVWSYACSSECKGSEPLEMSGIGTFCHEFSHVLGLPDLYDTDYEKNGTGTGVYTWSLMSKGNYNNAGRTPPYMGILERWMLGWADLPWWLEPGHKTLLPVHKNVGARTPCSTEDEFFLYEYRDGTGWDSYILAKAGSTPADGLLVYHVDMSNTLIGDGLRAIDLWNGNTVNCYAAHPCYALMPPVQSWGEYADMLYPGTSGTTRFSAVDWKGGETGYTLSDITVSGGSVTMNLSAPDNHTVRGRVFDSAGNPIEGAEVNVTDGSVLNASAYTKADGSYSITVDNSSSGLYTITISCNMYRTYSENLVLSTAEYVLDVVLHGNAEARTATLNKHGGYAGSNLGITSASSPWSATLAVRFSAAETQQYAGWKISTLNFLTNGTGASRISVFVDFGNRRMLTREVPAPLFGAYNKVDISDSGLTIPSGETVYIGYALEGTTEQYWIAIDSGLAVDGGGCVRTGYCNAGGNDWQDMGYNLLIDANLEEVVAMPLSAMKMKTIANPSAGEPYAVGSSFELRFDDPTVGETPSSVVWYYDGQAASGSVTLSSAGEHKITAILHYADGREEEIEQLILVR